MGNRLKAEIKQQKPFSSLAEEALLNLERTADRMRRGLQQALKPYGITATQYNALRILRGAIPDGLTCSELGDRLVTGDPDITRLLDRMARQGLVRRQRSERDRRVVLTVITCQGLTLLKDLAPRMDEQVEKQMAHMQPGQLHALINLLEEARMPADSWGGDENRERHLEPRDCEGLLSKDHVA